MSVRKRRKTQNHSSRTLMMKVNTALHKLVLESNNISDAVKQQIVVNRFVGDLVHNKVEYLDLHRTNISDEGAKALAEALKVTFGS